MFWDKTHFISGANLDSHLAPPPLSSVSQLHLSLFSITCPSGWSWLDWNWHSLGSQSFCGLRILCCQEIWTLQNGAFQFLHIWQTRRKIPEKKQETRSSCTTRNRTNLGSLCTKETERKSRVKCISLDQLPTELPCAAQSAKKFGASSRNERPSSLFWSSHLLPLYGLFFSVQHRPPPSISMCWLHVHMGMLYCAHMHTAIFCVCIAMHECYVYTQIWECGTCES